MTIKGGHHTIESRIKISIAKRGKPAWNKGKPGKIPSAATRAKMSASQKGKHSTGHPMSLESRARISAKLKGHATSVETIKKISDAKMGHPVSDIARLHMSLAQKGEKSHMYGKSVDKCIREKISLAQRGEKHHNWKGGISYEPYCPKWNKSLRKRIRAFFEYRCIICGKSTEENKRELCCHHVEYDKKACCDGKLVHFAALCHNCHARTNFDREQWERMIHRIIDEIYDGRSYYTKDEYAKLVEQE